MGKGNKHQRYGLRMDPNTRLYIMESRIGEIRRFWEMHGGCRILAVTVQEADLMEARLGWHAYDGLLGEVGRKLHAFAKGRPEAFSAVDSSYGEQFYVILPPSPNADAAEGELREALGQGMGKALPIAVESLSFKEAPGHRWEREFARIISRVRPKALLQGRSKEEICEDFLLDFTAKPVFTLDYQPIYALSDRTVIGYESLLRLPPSTPFAGNEVFFAYAEQTEYILKLEEAIWEKAVREFGPMARTILFFNVTPATLLRSRFFEEKSLHFDCDVVLEVTERMSIQDWTVFKERLSRLRERGLQVAIDDVGSGYSSLQAILELEPDYIKIDHSLVRALDRHPLKAKLVSMLLEAAKTIKCKVIAEGIETAEELACLEKLGVALGQGYFLRPPGALECI